MSHADLLNIRENEDTLKEKYLVFNIDSELYGMEICYITEIIGIQPITEIPDMPGYIKGVTNLRGQIIPVIDARLRLNKTAREYTSKTCIIVLESYHTSIGLIVDGVEEVQTMKDEDIVPPPNMNSMGCGYIKGFGKVDEKIEILLHCQKLLSDDELDMLNTIKM